MEPSIESQQAIEISLLRQWASYMAMPIWISGTQGHLLTAPEDYAKEAEFYRRLMVEAADGPVREVLELGSGGGNNASHLKEHLAMALTDLSDEMLAISRELNPECEHLIGDMRDLRLGREFDAVFVHDAVSYLTTVEDLGRAIETARCIVGRGARCCSAPTTYGRISSRRPGTEDTMAEGERSATWSGIPTRTQTIRRA